MSDQVNNTQETPKKEKRKPSKAPRHAMPEQAPEVRAKNFKEVPFGYTPEIAMAEADRCLFCKKPKCVEGCPVGIDIPGFILHIRDGNFQGAIDVLKQDNALPAICGRVCPQEEQCEELCILGKKKEPVAIGRLERFAADWERENHKIKVPVVPAPTGKKAAIIGSGPAGVTVAGELAKLGHSVTVFEALHKPGGVLMYGIPEFRLPKDIVQKEIDYVKSMGVEFVMDAVMGNLYTVEELMTEEGFDSVFIATGAGLPYFLNIPGENLIGVFSANEFLTRANLMKAYDFPRFDTPISPGKSAVVIGGGNVAMDSARTALRLGADVTLVYRRAREQMPARDEEIHHAEEEGIDFKLLCTPIRVNGTDDGHVKSITCLRMELGEPDDSGRRRPVPVEGSDFDIETETVIVSIGNGANPLLTQATPGLDLNKWGNIIADDDSCKTSLEGVYAGGDIVLGAATVILAMGAGKTAAKSMHDYMMSK